MNVAWKTLFTVVVLAVSTIALAKAGSTDIAYVRQDGNQRINVSLSKNTFQFTGRDNLKGDLGGIISDCSTPAAKCLSLSGYLLSVPNSNSPPNEWNAGGGTFSIAGHVVRDGTPVWIVRVTVKGDTYMFFSYSDRRGIESISLQREGANTDLVKTFFLDGDRGLLSPQ